MKSKTKKPTKAVKSSGLSVTVGSALDTLDLMRDEFSRILRLPCTLEVTGICERALLKIDRRVPVLRELEKTKAELASARLDTQRMTWLQDNGVCTPVGVRGSNKYELITREWIDHQIL